MGPYSKTLKKDTHSYSKIGDLVTYSYSKITEKDILLGPAPCRPYPISDPPGIVTREGKVRGVFSLCPQTPNQKKPT